MSTSQLIVISFKNASLLLIFYCYPMNFFVLCISGYDSLAGCNLEFYRSVHPDAVQTEIAFLSRSVVFTITHDGKIITSFNLFGFFLNTYGIVFMIWVNITYKQNNVFVFNNVALRGNAAQKVRTRSMCQWFSADWRISGVKCYENMKCKMPY